MKKEKVFKLTEKDIDKVFTSGKRKITIFDAFQSLFLGEDMHTGEEFTFYNTGECTGISCGWLEREMNKVEKEKLKIEMALGVPGEMIGKERRS